MGPDRIPALKPMFRFLFFVGLAAPASADVAISGQAELVTSPVPSLSWNQLESATHLRVIPEAQRLVLHRPLEVDHLVGGAVDLPAASTVAGSIAAGAVIDSHLLHADAPAGVTSPITFTATLTFDREILGFIHATSPVTTHPLAGNRFELSDWLLGGGTTFVRESEVNGERRRTADGEAGDSITIGADRHTLTVSLQVLGSDSRNLDQIRVITASVPVPESPAQPVEKPNVIVFLADDMGLGDTSAYQDFTGNPDASQIATPQLERLSRAGIRFTDAHTTSSVCSPSRYSLLTGRYSYRSSLKFGVLFGIHRDPIIEPERPTLATFFRDNGYATSLIGKWHLGVNYRDANGQPVDSAVTGEGAGHWAAADLTQPLARSPLDHGFDYFYGTDRSNDTAGPLPAENGPNQAEGPGWLESIEGPHGFGVYVTGATGNGKELDGSYVHAAVGKDKHAKAMTWLNGHLADRSDQPFFLYYASHANHVTHDPSDFIDGTRVAGAGRYKNGSASGPYTAARRDVIHENDVVVGKLLDWLETTPDPRRPGHMLADNTIFLFSSDNGAELNSPVATGSLRSNKASVYEGGHRVPFIASWPAGGFGDGDASDPGLQSPALISLVDLYATFAELLGAALPSPEKGEPGAEDSFSRLAALRGQADRLRPPLHLNEHKDAGGAGQTPARAWLALRFDHLRVGGQDLPGHWKLLIDNGLILGNPANDDPRQLFEIQTDLRESRDLFADPAFQPIRDALYQRAVEEFERGHSRRTLKPDLKIERSSLPPGFRLRTSGEEGIYYEFQSSPDLQQWSPLGGEFAGNDADVEIDAPAGSPRGFFRLISHQAPLPE